MASTIRFALGLTLIEGPLQIEIPSIEDGALCSDLPCFDLLALAEIFELLALAVDVPLLPVGISVNSTEESLQDLDKDALSFI
jgi:hypothetical protein